MAEDRGELAELLELPRRIEHVSAEARVAMLEGILMSLIGLMVHRGVLSRDEVVQMIDSFEAISMEGLSDFLQGEDANAKRVSQGLAKAVRLYSNALRGSL